ncbi:hypothetical protein PR048_004272 [Dryococelus australis]|uniref:Uncharacterized protein n=1 Tax=Dryococelus australis TaxID=614101 RepID=A0ABQ9I509_9NEOP|nr:hypothetical protein PR048_004272 [Dryococelus australis]
MSIEPGSNQAPTRRKSEDEHARSDKQMAEDDVPHSFHTATSLGHAARTPAKCDPGNPTHTTATLIACRPGQQHSSSAGGVKRATCRQFDGQFWVVEAADCGGFPEETRASAPRPQLERLEKPLPRELTLGIKSGGRKLNTVSANTRQKVKSRYRNRIRLERASQKQSIDTHKTPYDRVKRCRELSLLASHQGEPGSTPGRFTPGFSQVGMMPLVGGFFSGISRFPHPFIPVLLHTYLILPSSALKTSMLRAAQISSLAHKVASRHGGNTARLARRSDEALGVRVSVARIAPSLLDLGRAATQRQSCLCITTGLLCATWRKDAWRLEGRLADDEVEGWRSRMWSREGYSRTSQLPSQPHLWPWKLQAEGCSGDRTLEMRWTDLAGCAQPVPVSLHLTSPANMARFGF